MLKVSLQTGTNDILLFKLRVVILVTVALFYWK